MVTLEDIFGKAVTELTDEEKTYLKEHANQLNAEQKEKYADVLGKDEGGNSDNSDSSDSQSTDKSEEKTND